jgi:hypothetical protein
MSEHAFFPHAWRARLRAAAFTGACLATGCAALLPSSQTVVHGKWDSFEEAKAAIERIEPHRTSLADLRASGLDPYLNPNVELLNYSDILRRFPMAGSAGKLDPGLRECLEAGKACTGYAVDIKRADQKRVGNFLLDYFSFRRETESTGWTFNALVLIVGEDVVYSIYGGKPSIAETAKAVEPLGPVQNWNGSGLIR